MARRSDPERIYQARRAAVVAKLTGPVVIDQLEPSIGSPHGNAKPSGKGSTG